MQYITDILFWISTGLLVPVIVLLIYFFIRAVLLLGAFFGQYLRARRTEAILREKLKDLDASNIRSLPDRLPEKNDSPILSHIREMVKAADRPAEINHIEAEYELMADKELALSKTLTKMGPMLGLMGTLIPMGPALVGLSTGDIASMAYNMQVAFATTVIGLFSSAIGFVTLQAKQRWYLRDLTKLDYIADLLNPKVTEQYEA